jgi:hypothetical protein
MDAVIGGNEIADVRVNLEDQRLLRPRSAVMAEISGVLSVIAEDETAVGDSYAHLRRLRTDFYGRHARRLTGRASGRAARVSEPCKSVKKF